MKTPDKNTILSAISSDRESIMSFLSDMIACNSFSRNKPGIDRMANIVAERMPDGFDYECVETTDYGNHHIYSHVVGKDKPLVMAGHIDTLCPHDPEFDRLYVRGNMLYGPGVNDMKSGDVVLVWSLKILERLGLLDDFSVICIFNGDEELGSPSSRDVFKSMRNRARAAFVFECGGPENTVVTTRKGISRYRLHVEGKAAHFGNLKEPKVSAVEELARKAVAIEDLNAKDKSIVTNVGRIEGGLAANAVAERGSMDLEIRYWDSNLGKQAISQIESICAQPSVPGCINRLEQLSYRPAMRPTPESMQLFNRIVEIGTDLGERIIEEKRGGVSDACFLSDVGIPTIDGLGPLGDGDFTQEEHIDGDTLFKRIALTTMLVLSV